MYTITILWKPLFVAAHSSAMKGQVGVSEKRNSHSRVGSLSEWMRGKESETQKGSSRIQCTESTMVHLELVLGLISREAKLVFIGSLWGKRLVGERRNPGGKGHLRGKKVHDLSANCEH